MKNPPLTLLEKIGVDTRFISIVDNMIIINNQRFSKFSKTREHLFKKNLPQYRVIRSKYFQKIAIRASRHLKKELKPRETILVIKDNTCKNLTLRAVLEPYTRKYGLNIINDSDGSDLKNFNQIALPQTLDDTIISLLEQLLSGEKISLQKNHEFIYPIKNVPDEWIMSWIKEIDVDCTFKTPKGIENDMLNFLSTFIPDVREKMLKSATYIE